MAGPESESKQNDSKVYAPRCLAFLSLNYVLCCTFRGFPDSSGGKESACNLGDQGSIPGSGRSPGEGIGYPLQYSLASLYGLAGKELACNAGDLGSAAHLT